MARANDGSRELRARGKETRRRLLDAGADVFSKKGFHAARVDDIVKTARASHGTFYLYFANKDDLFSALAQEVAEQMAGLAESLGPITPDGAGQAELRSWLGRFSDMYAASGPVIGAWTEAETEGSDVGRIGTDLLSTFALALARRIAGHGGGGSGGEGAGGLDPQVASMALVAMIERFHYYALAGMVGADREAVLDTLAAVTHAALFGAPATARLA